MNDSVDLSESRANFGLGLSQESVSVGTTESSRVRQRFTKKVKGVKDLKYGYKFTTSLDVNRGETGSGLKR